MKEGEPLKIDDFAPLSPLVKGYEFRPGCAYLILCDGKKFSASAAYALMRDIRQMHPDVQIAIIVTPEVQSVQIREKTETPDPHGDPASG